MTKKYICHTRAGGYPDRGNIDNELDSSRFGGTEMTIIMLGILDYLLESIRPLADGNDDKYVKDFRLSAGVYPPKAGRNKHTTS